MSIEDIEQEVLTWHRETFPRATDMAVIKKFTEEVRELYESVFLDEGETPDELADVCITAIAMLGRHELKLSSVIREKLAINKSRTWGEETENGDRPRVKP